MFRGRWTVQKRGGVWGVYRPWETLPCLTYWDHWDAIRRAQQLSRGLK
jgi:hypothetical protein